MKRLSALALALGIYLAFSFSVAIARDLPKTNEVAIIKTTEGDITLEFWSDVAPKTVENFKNLARTNFYNGTIFHRIIQNFMIQGGDPLTKDISKTNFYGTGGPGYTIPAEFNSRKHVRGVISMARSSNPNSAGSQFFICLTNTPHLDGQYTAFGRMIAGDDVLSKIANTPVGRAPSGELSWPHKRIQILDVEVIEPRPMLGLPFRGRGNSFMFQLSTLSTGTNIISVADALQGPWIDILTTNLPPTNVTIQIPAPGPSRFVKVRQER